MMEEIAQQLGMFYFPESATRPAYFQDMLFMAGHNHAPNGWVVHLFDTATDINDAIAKKLSRVASIKTEIMREYIK